MFILKRFFNLFFPIKVKDTVHSTSQSQVEKMVETQERGIFKEVGIKWINAGVKVVSLKKGLSLYSGQRSENKTDFDYSYNMDKFKLGIWLSENPLYAKDYCYYHANEKTIGKVLFFLHISCDIDVLLFPSHYHPADAINKNIDGLPPDVFISKNWIFFRDALVSLDNKYSSIKGHARKQNSKETIKNPTLNLSEVWIQDKVYLNEIKAYTVPNTKSEFNQKYGTNVVNLLKDDL